MRRNPVAWMAAIIGLAGAFVLAQSAPALAHVHRTVGPYHFVVGWGDEPAYAGLKNSVQLLLTDRADKPVIDLGDSLKVEVIFGGQKMEFPLVPAFDPDEGFGTPGDYRAWLIPTSPGTYTFHFFGTIGKQKVDQRFTSGPTTFDDVTDPSDVEFPAKVPTGTELAARIDREVPRLHVEIASARSDADHSTRTARTLGIVGIVVGTLGLLVAIWAVLAAGRMRRRTTAAAPAPTNAGARS